MPSKHTSTTWIYCWRTSAPTISFTLQLLLFHPPIKTTKNCFQQKPFSESSITGERCEGSSEILSMKTSNRKGPPAWKYIISNYITTPSCRISPPIYQQNNIIPAFLGQSATPLSGRSSWEKIQSNYLMKIASINFPHDKLTRIKLSCRFSLLCR